MSRASSKGLFAGSGLIICLRSGGTVTGNDYDSTLIPCNAEIETLVIRQDIAFVLVVEKEAVFQTLCRIGFPRHELLIGSGIIVTGKGYPDVATRELVNTFSNELPDSIPILALVDADPHGIEILSVFKYGSSAMSHQKDTLSAPRMQWIGVFASELRSFGVSEQDLIPLTKLDHKKAMSMLRRADDSMPLPWKFVAFLAHRNYLKPAMRELSHILHSRCKAEIEIISNAAVPLGRLHQEGVLNDENDWAYDLAFEPAAITGSTLLAVYLASKINAAMNAARTVIALPLGEGTFLKEEPSI
ncbi:endodeoxyribonuclease [Tulasnella sp. 427]|nr:endodeoxyribonuclease [Tulasnella sp. 427]